jgi:hypothetical protein
MHSIAHVPAAQTNAVRTPEQSTSIRLARPRHARGCANKVLTCTQTNGGERIRVVDLLRSMAAPADECEDSGPTSRRGCLRRGRAMDPDYETGTTSTPRDRIDLRHSATRLFVLSSNDEPGGGAEVRHQCFVRLTSPPNLVRRHEEQGAGSPRGPRSLRYGAARKSIPPPKWKHTSEGGQSGAREQRRMPSQRKLVGERKKRWGVGREALIDVVSRLTLTRELCA